MNLSAFKAYDIRGRLGEELNEEFAYKLGRAYAQYFTPKRVVVGADVRESSESLKSALSDGLREGGVDVVDLGLAGTEEVYFATAHLGVDGGIEVTASHNPIDYNGMKLVKRGSEPISGETGLHAIRDLMAGETFERREVLGALEHYDCKKDFTTFLMKFIDSELIKPLKIVVNAGNGCAGPLLDIIEEEFTKFNIPVEMIKIHHEPDGTFPHGIPNPLLPENRSATTQAVIEHEADLGIAWDGDFDRCFFFDEKGAFVEGYYIVGLLAEAFLQKHQGEKIIHDPRLTWNTIAIVEKNGGIPIISKTGHAFIKEKMRQENAIYGGEMSAHHYFRDFFYCDSGMIPWLLVIELLSCKEVPLSELLENMQKKFPCSGEINRVVKNPDAVIDKLRKFYENESLEVSTIDGLSMEFPNWRFNVRKSNTEPLLRLNVESQGGVELMRNKIVKVLEEIH